MNTIMITPKVTAAWNTDTNGVRRVVATVPTMELRLPRKNLKGKTAADIGWTALGNAPITHDNRF
jgi:hypothetical protein